MTCIFPEQDRKIAVLLTLEERGSARAQQVANAPAKQGEFLSRAPELTCEPKCRVHMYSPKCTKSQGPGWGGGGGRELTGLQHQSECGYSGSMSIGPLQTRQWLLRSN